MTEIKINAQNIQNKTTCKFSLDFLPAWVKNKNNREEQDDKHWE